MNKSTSRSQKADNLSRIQASLQSMKEEVTQYLKKTKIDTVPPILRARNYLILSYIENAEAKDKVGVGKIKRELSS